MIIESKEQSSMQEKFLYKKEGLKIIKFKSKKVFVMAIVILFLRHKPDVSW